MELESKHGMWDRGRDRALGTCMPSAWLVQSEIQESWAKGCTAQGRAHEIFKLGRDRGGDVEPTLIAAMSISPARIN